MDGEALMPHLAGQHLPVRRSLLELAEQRGLVPAYGCRAGSCGDCRTPITKGEASYLSEPSYPVASGEALVCISIPAEVGDLRLAM